MFAQKLKQSVASLGRRLPWRPRPEANRKRIGRSDVYRTAAAEAAERWREGQPEPAIARLLQGGAEVGVGFATVPEAWWTRFLAAHAAPAEQFAKAERELAEHTDALPHEGMAAAVWLDLYAMCLRVGLFDTAYRLRAKAREAALSAADGAAKPDPEMLRLALAAALDLGRWSSAEAQIAKLSRRADAGRVETARWLLALLAGEALSPPVAAEPEVQRFHGLVGGKSLALVGPVVPADMPGPEIDSFDLVVKLNTRSGGQGCDPATQGARVDISYYNNEQTRYLTQTLGQEIPAELQAAVVKRRGRLPKGSRRDLRVRAMSRLDWLMFDGSFNAIPNAALDLLRFAPAGIKVFNTDLMLSVARYKGYRPQQLGEIDHARSFVVHCPLAQYNVLAHLHRAGRIEGDATFARVMALGEAAYMRELQRVHGRQPDAVHHQSSERT